VNKITIILLAFILIASACKKDEEETKSDPVVETGSLKMVYDGVTYTDVDQKSLHLAYGVLTAKGTIGDGFLLSIIGVGEDGSTVNFKPGITSVMLDFGAAAGKEGFVAQSGTIKRTGKKVEIDVAGVTTSGDQKTLTATIVVIDVMGK